MKRVYLAGPEVFTRQPLSLGARKKDICAAHGLIGVFPMELVRLDLTADKVSQGLSIYDVMHAAMRDCDAIIANMTPYHGPSADVGTAYEMGFMGGLGRPIFAYSNDARLFADRVEAFHGGRLVTRFNGEREGPDRMALEEFDMADNLMLVGGALRSSGVIETATSSDDVRYTDLVAFEACVKKAATWLAQTR